MLTPQAHAAAGSQVTLSVGPTAVDRRGKYAYSTDVRVVWDSAKAKANFLKHRIRFSDAAGVLFDPMALTHEDERNEGERRFVSIGIDHLTRVVVVVFASRGDSIRLISARRASKRERYEYAQRVRF